MQRVRDFGQLSALSNSSLKKSIIYMDEEMKKIVRDIDNGRWKEKTSSGHHRTNKEIKSQRL